jgi:hypothetical protein
MYPQSLSDGNIPLEEPLTDVLDTKQSRNFLAIHGLLFKVKNLHRLSPRWY